MSLFERKSAIAATYPHLSGGHDQAERKAENLTLSHQRITLELKRLMRSLIASHHRGLSRCKSQFSSRPTSLVCFNENQVNWGESNFYIYNILGLNLAVQVISDGRYRIMLEQHKPFYIKIPASFSKKRGFQQSTFAFSEFVLDALKVQLRSGWSLEQKKVSRRYSLNFIVLQIYFVKSGTCDPSNVVQEVEQELAALDEFADFFARLAPLVENFKTYLAEINDNHLAII